MSWELRIPPPKYGFEFVVQDFGSGLWQQIGDQVVVLDKFPLLISHVLCDHAIAAERTPLHKSIESFSPLILVNIAIIRTFVRLRQILATHQELARELEELRWRQDEQGL